LISTSPTRTPYSVSVMPHIRRVLTKASGGGTADTGSVPPTGSGGGFPKGMRSIITWYREMLMGDAAPQPAVTARCRAKPTNNTNCILLITFIVAYASLFCNHNVGTTAASVVPDEPAVIVSRLTDYGAPWRLIPTISTSDRRGRMPKVDAIIIPLYPFCSHPSRNRRRYPAQ